MNISIWIKIIVIAFIAVTFGLILYGRKTGLINDRNMEILEKIVSVSLVIIAIMAFFIKFFIYKTPLKLSQLSPYGILGLSSIIIISRKTTCKK